MPILLGSGQSEDVWPNTQMVLVDFYTATDRLEEQVREDGHLVVRCLHSGDHWGTPYGMFDSAISWLTEHTYGEDSPFQSDISSLSNCGD